jgi:hypothetical protein
MPYCSRCGIEVENHILKCPLCNTEIQNFNNPPEIPENFPEDDYTSKDYYIPFEMKKKILWSIVSFLIATSLFIIFSVNFFLERTITWAWIPLFSILSTWLVFASIYYLYKKIFFLLLSLFVFISLYLFFLFLIILNFRLFFSFALPIVIATFFNTLIVIFLYKITKRRGYNIIGFILIAISFYSIIVDIIITFYITGKIVMTWSIVVIAFLIPLAFLLFFIHYKLKKNPDVKKIFHI